MVTQALLADARNGDPAALSRLCQRIQSELAGIARAVQCRMGGSPDGVNGVSDLAESVAVEIIAQPGQKLGAIKSITELRGRLYVLLTQKWIDRRRKAICQKRGGGRTVTASQLGDADDSSLLKNVAAPTLGETRDDINALLSVYEPGSERQRIILLTLMGLTHDEIGELLGLSRDAVGRRLRDHIIEPLKKKFAEET